MSRHTDFLCVLRGADQQNPFSRMPFLVARSSSSSSYTTLLLSTPRRCGCIALARCRFRSQSCGMCQPLLPHHPRSFPLPCSRYLMLLLYWFTFFVSPLFVCYDLFLPCGLCILIALVASCRFNVPVLCRGGSASMRRHTHHRIHRVVKAARRCRTPNERYIYWFKDTMRGSLIAGVFFALSLLFPMGSHVTGSCERGDLRSIDQYF